MRYNTVDDIVYTDKNGTNYTVKDRREIPEYETGLIIKNEKNLFLDELASRPEYFGDNSEDLMYVIVDHNVEKITENNFNLSMLKEIKIPILENI